MIGTSVIVLFSGAVSESPLPVFLIMLPEFDQSEDRGRGVRSDFNEVQSFVACQLKGRGERHDAKLRLIGIDQPHLAGTDFPWKIV